MYSIYDGAFLIAAFNLLSDAIAYTDRTAKMRTLDKPTYTIKNKHGQTIYTTADGLARLLADYCFIA